jgi:cell division protein FtsI (penicillin-binding protein 3)
MRTLAAICQRIGRPGREGAARNVRNGHMLLSFCFVAGFMAVTGKAIHYAAVPADLPMLAASGAPPALAKSRPDIVDRNGRQLATDIRVYWLAANPKEVPNADDAAEKLTGLFKDLDQAALAKKFHDKTSRFEWVKRGLTPNQAKAAHDLGIPGLSLLPTVQRVYPAGNDAAQILGITDIDNEGRSGIEWYIDQKMAGQLTPASLAQRPFVKLSLDIGVQHALVEELSRAMQRYKAAAVLGLVLNVRNGEVLAAASLPGFDPNRRDQVADENRRNRVVADVYELGSVFKTFTIAMALDQGIAGRYERFDASPLKVEHFLLRGPHSGREPMSVEDIYIHSSNTGAARIAMAAGVARQQHFLETLGFFEKLETEAGTAPKSVLNGNWGPAKSATVAYGHGIAVSPIVFAAAMAAIVNGGERVKPAFMLADDPPDGDAERVIQRETSSTMRELMRLVVERGTGRRAAVAGLDIGGKTGTAWKAKDGHYTRDVINSFVAAIPIANPKYLILVTIDEPKPEAPGKPDEAAYNAAPTAATIIKRIAPMLDILPDPEFDGKAATSYEQAGVEDPQRAVFRKNPDEPSGFAEGYSAHRQREPALDSQYYRPYGR